MPRPRKAKAVAVQPEPEPQFIAPLPKMSTVGTEETSRNLKKHLKFNQDENPQGDSEDSEDDESDEEEDENGELVTPQVDAQIMKTIALIRKRDPTLYDSKVEFFSQNQMDDAQSKWDMKQKQLKSAKPVTLKEYQMKSLLDGDSTGMDSVIENRHLLTFNEEQMNLKMSLKSAFQDAIDDDVFHDEDEFIKIRSKKSDEIHKEEEDYKDFLLDNMGANSSETKDVWTELTNREATNTDDAFLMNYVLSKGWIDQESKYLPSYDEVVDVEKDEDHLEEADDFERRHNFRFEEEGSANLVSHARDIGNSVRRTDDSRKNERERKKERKEAEALKRAEELKRKKNLKKIEIAEKLKQIHEYAGFTDGQGLDIETLEQVVENDFNPEDYDAKMNILFGEDNALDEAGIKPKFADDISVGDASDGDEEDIYDSVGEGEGEEILNTQEEFIAPERSETDIKNSEEAKTELGKCLEEYYKMDYEDMIDEMPTRFKYCQVPKQNFGLDPIEILMADDADLNNYWSVKKLAPFRRPEVVEMDMKRFKKTKSQRMHEFKEKMRAKRFGKDKRQREVETEAEEQTPTVTNLKVSKERLSTYQLPKTKKQKF